MTDYEKMRLKIELEKLKAIPRALAVIFPSVIEADQDAFKEWSANLTIWAYEQQKELDHLED